MIYIYGDSHAEFSFKNLQLPYKDYHSDSVTMHRIGRDNIIVNFNKIKHTNDSIICLVYGEVDCRCHIQRQINTGKDEDEIINELVGNYFKTIKNNIIIYKKIIIVGIIPPTKQSDHEIIHGPITHAFPFVGNDEDRVRYTKKTNKLIEELCIRDNYTYFNPYSFYTRGDGTLRHELSDSKVHLGNTCFFIAKFVDLYNKINI